MSGERRVRHILPRHANSSRGTCRHDDPGPARGWRRRQRRPRTKTKGQNSGWIVITAGWAIAVAVAVYAVGRISGAHLNPAVTIALATIGSFPWAEVPGYIGAQMVGAILGAVLVWLDVPAALGLTTDPGSKLGRVLHRARRSATPAANMHQARSSAPRCCCSAFWRSPPTRKRCRSPATSICRSSSAAACSRCWSVCLVFGIGLSLGGPTGYAHQPGARSRSAHRPRHPADSRQRIVGLGIRWIPVVAPIIGGIAGAGLYSIDWILRRT